MEKITINDEIVFYFILFFFYAEPNLQSVDMMTSEKHINIVRQTYQKYQTLVETAFRSIKQ